MNDVNLLPADNYVVVNKTILTDTDKVNLINLYERRRIMPFEFERQKIKDVILVKPKVFGDNRGFFMEAYKKSDFVANGIDVEFNQNW